MAKESFIFTLKISSLRARTLVAAMALSGALAVLWPAVGHTDVVQAPGTESSAGGATDAWLVTRGLIGHGMIGEQSAPDVLMPASGVEVDETRQTEDSTGRVVMQVKLWDEKVGDDIVHIEVATLTSNQFEVSFWLFPNHRQGCTMYQWTLYDHGRALQSAFWRNDAPVLRLAGAADLPHDLYPDAVPWMAFLRVLDAPREGGEGALHQQITPYSYVGQNVLVKGDRADKRAGRQLLRAQDQRSSRHRHGNAELAALRDARRPAGGSEEHALLPGDPALPAAQATGRHLRRRS